MKAPNGAGTNLTARQQGLRFRQTMIGIDRTRDFLRRRIVRVLTGLVTAATVTLGSTSAWAADRAAMVIDANSGNVLYNAEGDAPRYPASLTKMMTLYLTFELIEKGRLAYSDRIKVSAQAAAQPPSKLDLDAGDTISVQDAVSAIVTKSANDIAVALAEHVGGSEANFARLMTRKAREIGMSKTTFKNASGLPNNEQMTTARDMLTLALRLQDDFPKHYEVFSTRRFSFKGSSFANHNTLLYHYRGTDGIKTGYTRAAGFNLVASVRRDGKHLVAAVFGGKSAGRRNADMRAILDRAFARAATRKSRKSTPQLIAAPKPVQRAPRVAEAPKSRPQPVQNSPAQIAPPPTPAPRATAEAGNGAPAPDPRVTIARVRAVGVSEHLAEQRAKRAERLAAAGTSGAAPSSIGELIAAATAERAGPQPSALGMQVDGAISPTRSASTPIGLAGNAISEPRAADDAANATTAAADTPGRPPSSLQEQLSGILAANRPSAMDDSSNPTTPVIETPAPTARRISGSPRPDNGSSGAKPGTFQIQIGAYGSADEAQRQLNSARQRAATVLDGAAPLTETVTRGQKLYYRARFAGFDSSGATTACQELRRYSIDCFVAKAQ